MEEGASEEAVSQILAAVEAEGLRPFINPGVERKVIAIIGVVNAEKMALADKFASFSGVERVALVSEPYKLVSRAHHPAGSVFTIRGVAIGAQELCVIAGPCSVESREQTLEVACAAVKPGRTCCAGAPSSRAPRLTHFRGWG